MTGTREKTADLINLGNDMESGSGSEAGMGTDELGTEDSDGTIESPFTPLIVTPNQPGQIAGL
jgi:hypothetical protein